MRAPSSDSEPSFAISNQQSAIRNQTFSTASSYPAPAPIFS